MTIVDVHLGDEEVFDPQLPPSPYPGLRPFQKAEWPIFFGRERMTDNVISLLMKQRLLVVHGTSGNGKSSLIRAGVLARLEQEHARSDVRWRTGAMNPGHDSLVNLAKSFASVAPSPRGDWIEFRRALNHGRQSANAVARLLELNEGNRLCILIDQFEEIFNNPGNVRADQSTLFSEFLVGFSERPPEGLFVLVTMRSEFLGLCSRFAGLAEAINTSQYLLPRMETEDLLRAVREPAVLYGGAVTEQLAERLIIDARSSQDELPLIQHGLSQLWESGVRSAFGESPLILDLQRYSSVGSLSTLISDHADQVTSELVDSSGADLTIVEGLFRALTAINSEGHAVRRQQSFGALLAVTGASELRLRKILDGFRRPGVSFITPYPPMPIGSETLIDISHEALIRHWKKISEPTKGWLQKEFRDGLIWQALRVQAESFLANPENLLSEATTEGRSAWLRDRNEAWCQRYGGMWQEVERLIIASREKIADQKRQEKKNREDIEHGKRLRLYMILATAASVVLIGFAIVLFAAKQKAESEKSNADAARGLATAEAQRAVEEKGRADVARLAATSAQKLAETEAQRALEAKQQAEVEKLKAVEERARADSARDLAELALQRAETEAQRALESKKQAEAQKSRAEEEKEKADKASAEAIVAQQRAETEKQKALEAMQKAEVEQQNARRAQKVAEDALLQARDDAKRAAEAADRASKFQDESAITYLASRERSRDTLVRTLGAFYNERDPLKLAFYGQVIGQLANFATSADIHMVMQTLIQNIGRRQDSASTSAISQALATIAGNLSGDQAQVEASSLLKDLSGTTSRDNIKGIAIAFGAMAPKVRRETADQIKPFLSRALATTVDPDTAGAIATALSSLNWAPSSNEADLAIGNVLKLLRRTSDDNLIATLGNVITIVTPKLGLQMAAEAMDEIQSMNPHFSESLKPALNALEARKNKNPAPKDQQNLIQRLDADRWCTTSRSYTMQVVGSTIIWRDNLGSVDTEQIVSTGTADAQTTTLKSVHTDGKSEPPGTTWTYRLVSGSDKVSVKSSSGKSFSLTRC